MDLKMGLQFYGLFSAPLEIKCWSPLNLVDLLDSSYCILLLDGSPEPNGLL